MTTLQKIKQLYQLCKVGQCIFVQGHSRKYGWVESARVVGVGRKYVHISGGRKLETRDIVDVWGDVSS